MQYKVELIVQVPDDNQELMHEYVPGTIERTFRGTRVWVQEIRFQNINIPSDAPPTIFKLGE